MDITQSYQQLSATLKGYSALNSGSVSLVRQDASQMHNKAYRDVVVSSNILRKSVQLYNDVMASNSQSDKLLDMGNALEEIQAGSLQDVLQSYVTTDIRDIIAQARGQNLDQLES